MAIKYMHFIICIIFGLSIGLLDSCAAEVCVDVAGKMMIDTPKGAIKRALSYSGFERLEKYPIDDTASNLVKFKVGTDTSSEFARKEIYKSKLWCVRYENVILDLENIASEVEQQYPKDFELLIDAESGSLLEVRGTASGLSRENAQRELKNEAASPFDPIGEQYHSIPEELPKISLIRALDLCNCHPVFAKKITAVYVLYSYDHTKIRQPNADTSNILIPAWVIYLDGLPPWSSSENGPEYSNERVVINAMTGQRIVGPFSYSKKNAGDSSGNN
jgi:hypothetical protein